jgi:catechol 2,3-dioxygenase-like lactoylglutathione lyase family enzyme
MAKAIHMMVRVLDERCSVDFYDRAFGLKIADRFDFDDFSLVCLRNAENDFEVELTVNKGRTEPYRHGVQGAGAESRRDQGVPPRGRADGALLLRPGPGRLQDRPVLKKSRIIVASLFLGRGRSEDGYLSGGGRRRPRAGRA